MQSRIVPDEIHPIAHTHVHVMDNDDEDSEDSIPIHVPHIKVIESDDDSNGNVFVFVAFADKRNGTLYSNLTGTFPFMSLEGSFFPCSVPLRYQCYQGGTNCKLYQ